MKAKGINYYVVSAILLLALISSWFFNLHIGHDFDNFCWRWWSTHLTDHGISSAYDIEINYPPLFLYILTLFGTIVGGSENINSMAIYVRDIPFFFEIFSLLLGLFLIKKFEINPYWLLVLLFNPAFWYNSQVWGQVDGIHTAFVFAVFFFLLTGHITLGLVFLVLALNMKLQSIVFLPLILFICIPAIRQYQKRFLPALLLAGIFQLMILVPFLNDFNKLWDTITGSVDFFPVVSMNAFNMWYIFLEGDPMQISDSETFLSITYKTWGLSLFFLSSFIFLLPLFISSILKLLYYDDLFEKHYFSLIMLSAALVASGFFYFNTQMHERYLHPAILFSGIYFITTKRWIPFLLLSIGYILNLEKVLKALQLNNYKTLIFTEEFIAGVIFLGIIFSVYELYKFYFRMENIKLEQLLNYRLLLNKKAAERQL